MILRVGIFPSAIKMCIRDRTKVVQDYSHEAASYALGVDLDLCNVNMTFNGDIVGGITFDGKDHTIFNVKRSEGSVYHATGSIYGYGDNVTVKDPVSYTHLDVYKRQDCSGPHFRGDRRDGSERPDGR